VGFTSDCLGDEKWDRDIYVIFSGYGRSFFIGWQGMSRLESALFKDSIKEPSLRTRNKEEG
jgi:hypothetical protein